MSDKKLDLNSIINKNNELNESKEELPISVEKQDNTEVIEDIETNTNINNSETENIIDFNLENQVNNEMGMQDIIEFNTESNDEQSIENNGLEKIQIKLPNKPEETESLDSEEGDKHTQEQENDSREKIDEVKKIKFDSSMFKNQEKPLVEEEEKKEEVKEEVLEEPINEATNVIEDINEELGITKEEDYSNITSKVIVDEINESEVLNSGEELFTNYISDLEAKTDNNKKIEEIKGEIDNNSSENNKSAIENQKNNLVKKQNKFKTIYIIIPLFFITIIFSGLYFKDDLSSLFKGEDDNIIPIDQQEIDDNNESENGNIEEENNNDDDNINELEQKELDNYIDTLKEKNYTEEEINNLIKEKILEIYFKKSIK